MGLVIDGKEVIDMNLSGDTPVLEAWLDGVKLWPDDDPGDWLIVITGIGTIEIAGVAWVHGFGTNEGDKHGAYDIANLIYEPDGTFIGGFDLTNQAATIDYTAVDNIQFVVDATSPLAALSAPWVLYTSAMLPDAPPMVFRPEDFGTIVQFRSGADFPNAWAKDNLFPYRNDEYTPGAMDDNQPLELFFPSLPTPTGPPTVVTGQKCNAVRQIAFGGDGTITDLNLIADGNENTHMIYAPNINRPTTSTLSIGVTFPVALAANEIITDYAIRVKGAKSGTGGSVGAVTVKTNNPGVSVQNNNAMSFTFDLTAPEVIEHNLNGKGGLLGGGELINPHWQGGEVLLDMGYAGAVNGAWELYYVEIDYTIQAYDSLVSPIQESPKAHAPNLVSAAGWQQTQYAIDGEANFYAIYQWTGATPTGVITVGWSPNLPAGSTILGYELYIDAQWQSGKTFNMAWVLSGNGLIGQNKAAQAITSLDWEAPRNAITDPNYNNLVGDSAAIIDAWNNIQLAFTAGPMAQAGDASQFAGAWLEIIYTMPGSEAIRSMKLPANAFSSKTKKRENP